MTSSHGRRIQSRRALAILSWITLVIVAWLLANGRHNGAIRVQAWEPAALILSAYATFLSIFSWMLFSPARASAEESPALFFSGLLTLIPPCFIAYNLMPSESPLRPWLTIGVFLFGMLAILSPLPDEVFAVPRHRRSYLQPLTDAYLSEINAEAPQVNFDRVAPRTKFWLTEPLPAPESSGPATARDPWADPFRGTGRQISRIGVSKSLRSERPSKDSTHYEELDAAPDETEDCSSRNDDMPEKHGAASLVTSPGAKSVERSVPPIVSSSTRRPLREMPDVARPTLQQLDRQVREQEQQNDLADDAAADLSGAVPSATATVLPQTSGNFKLERIQDNLGGEMIEGTVKVQFEVGQRRAHLHVPFSPPLPGVPEVECEPVGEEPIRLKAAVRQPYGIRIEARRSDAAQPLTADVSFAAVYTPSFRKNRG